MRNKAITLLTITALVLGVSACGKKEVASVVSEVTSVTEKVQETNTSIADKIDNINVDEKTDLSNLPEIEVPDVPEVVEDAEVKEPVAMTIEEYDKAIKKYTDDYPIQGDDWDESYTDEMKEEQIKSDYIYELYDNNPSLADITLGEYFGEAIDQIPHADKQETFAKYNEAEDAYRSYYTELLIDEFMIENTGAESQFSGAKNLTRTDFHHDLVSALALWKK